MNNKQDLARKQDIAGFVAALAITAVVFVITITFIYPVNFSRLGGYHNWLNGSTIKFVNEWLDEGAADLHFTMYEYPDEIERAGLDREPYVSYPNGTIVTVWALAAISGHSHIGISFLKGIACLFYYMDAMLFAGFVYLFLAGFKIKSVPFRSIASAVCASCWLLQPVNVYYLANIFFADQYVTFWILAFLLVEYIDIRDPKLRSKIIKAVIIYCGCMVDYYFWIMTAIAWALDLVALIIRRSKAGKYLAALGLYAGPALLAVLSYYIQMSYTDNWFTLLTDRFKLRVSNEGEAGVSDSGIAGIMKFFKQAYCDDSKKRAILLALFVLITVILAVRYLIREKKLKDVFTDGRLRILLLGSMAPVAQILVLKNHSGVHEFSMIKLAWCIAMMPIVLPLMYRQKEESISEKRESGEAPYFPVARKNVICFAMAMLICGIPFSSIEYINSRYYGSGEETKNLSLAEILRNNTSYENVCFSFSKEIPVTPPQLLAVSCKRVYKITALEETESLFPKLPTEAVKILIIDKKDRSLPMELAENLSVLIEKNEHIYEDESFCLLKLDTPPR